MTSWRRLFNTVFPQKIAMHRPPSRPKSGTSPIGRTRASDAQKLLAPQKKTASAGVVRRTGASNNAYAFGAPLSNQVKLRGSAQLRKNKVGLARIPPVAIGGGSALLAALLPVAGVSIFFAAAAACIL